MHKNIKNHKMNTVLTAKAIPHQAQYLDVFASVLGYKVSYTVPRRKKDFIQILAGTEK